MLKCRPPHNRDPKPEEVAVCRHFLDRQLQLLAPKVLVLMGRPAASAVLGTDQAISRLRGKLFEIEVAGKKVPVIVTYHPSYLLRNLADKEKCWHDLLFVKRTLKEAEAALMTSKLSYLPSLFLAPEGSISSFDGAKATKTYSLPATASPIMLERS